MKRTDEFECKLDALIDEFSDLSCQDMADSLEYYYQQMQSKANTEK